MSKNENINIIINDKEVVISADKGKMPLLSYLRDEMGLMGSKNGCGQGHCGACAVIVDGKSKRSCLWRLERLDGSEVETIENLSKNGKLHPLQIAFLEAGAVQCGFCTPGMIISAKALLDKNPKPSKEDIKDALKRNICRCTGYKKIIEAVELAAEYIREGKDEFKEKEVIGALGESVIRNDGIEKVTGKPLFVDDFYRDDMLYGKLHLSEKPHAKILDIDISEAESVPGVVKVLTHEDVPGQKDFGMIYDQQPFLAYDKVRYVGAPIAAVLAESEEIAEKAAKKVKVEYEELPAYYTPQEALAEDAVDIHEVGKIEGNLFHNPSIEKGDVDEGFEEADVIIESTYKTPSIEHGYLEPEGGLAEYDEDGRLVVTAPNQSSHHLAHFIADSLGLEHDEVRVINPRTGGGFGGKEEPTNQIHAALGTMLTKRPVKMVLTRKESIRMSTKRHAAYSRYKMGATKDGKLVAGEAEYYVDTGAHASIGSAVVDRITAFAFGSYELPNARVDTKGVYTNNMPAGALRGFGSPQACFTAERHIDKLARALDMDPIEFRLKNALDVGKATITGQVIDPGIGYKECLEAVKDALDKEDLEPTGDNKEITVGVSGAFKNVGIGNGIPEDNQARMKINEDGTLTLYIGAVDMGQGSDTAMAQIASEVLGCSYHDIKVISSDTDYIDDVGATTASRMTFLSGNSTYGCATEFKELLLEKAAELNDTVADNLEFGGKEFVNIETGEVVANLQDIADNYPDLKVKYDYTPPKTEPLPESKVPAYPTKETEVGHVHFAYCYATHAAIIEIDKETNEFEVKKIIAAHDAGKAINPLQVEGQIEGGASMGYGYGVSEEFYVDEETGMPVQDTMIKLGLPTAKNMPDVESIIIEEEHPDGPYGAKGMSELPVSPVAPAIANGLAKATGYEYNEIPLGSNKIEEPEDKDYFNLK
ncbi:MAG: molybdopterin-dependent oxidoreductase [Bacillota bacterium]